MKYLTWATCIVQKTAHYFQPAHCNGREAFQSTNAAMLTKDAIAGVVCNGAQEGESSSRLVAD